MANIATTIEEQIDMLKRRGLYIENEEKAKEILSDIGYYRLGFYWYRFEIDADERDRKHMFKEGATFKDAVELYNFDNELRCLLIKSITRIEVNFRTQLTYEKKLATRKVR